jgi:dCMP deaminase
MTKYDTMYMNMTEVLAAASVATRLKVGCLIVKDNLIMAEGFNGTPAGWATNVCEDDDGLTSDITVHAELNSLMKASRHGRATNGATLYCSHAPCNNCSKHILSAGIVRVVYKNTYRCSRGLDILLAGGVEVTQLQY